MGTCRVLFVDGVEIVEIQGRCVSSVQRVGLIDITGLQKVKVKTLLVGQFISIQTCQKGSTIRFPGLMFVKIDECKGGLVDALYQAAGIFLSGRMPFTGLLANTSCNTVGSGKGLRITQDHIHKQGAGAGIGLQYLVQEPGGL
ncbi:hypothetical protein QA596_02755 [Balneolales bacterium ANBcel1]|nr:hypothetical protein [Balneolales bacterium ANBcel1]